MEQDRLRRCPHCGELTGEARVDDEWLPVLCSCDGIACRRCGNKAIRRPSSNFYVEATGRAIHSPWFMYLFPCAECRRAEGR